MLAVPGVIMCTCLIAVMVKYLYNFDDWNACFMIGAMLSATDPVAVVALMKELGASSRLSTLIEGESLLNDGSAVVLFVWISNVIGYDALTKPPEWMAQDFGERQIGYELMRIVAQMLFTHLFFSLSPSCFS